MDWSLAAIAPVEALALLHKTCTELALADVEARFGERLLSWPVAGRKRWHAHAATPAPPVSRRNPGALGRLAPFHD